MWNPHNHQPLTTLKTFPAHINQLIITTTSKCEIHQTLTTLKSLPAHPCHWWYCCLWKICLVIVLHCHTDWMGEMGRTMMMTLTTTFQSNAIRWRQYAGKHLLKVHNSIKILWWLWWKQHITTSPSAAALEEAAVSIRSYGSKQRRGKMKGMLAAETISCNKKIKRHKIHWNVLGLFK